MFDLRQVPNPKGNVELIETIGKGNFGFVYKVEWRVHTMTNACGNIGKIGCYSGNCRRKGCSTQAGRVAGDSSRG